MAKTESHRSKPSGKRERQQNKEKIDTARLRESSWEEIKRSGEPSLEGGLSRSKQDGADIGTFRRGGRKLKIISTFSVKVEVE